MFCANCGNEIADNENFCPKCGASQQNDGNSSDTPFIPGKFSIYEQYKFMYKRTCFGLTRVWHLFVKIFGDTGPGEEPTNYWHMNCHELKINKDKLVIFQWRQIVFMCIPLFSKKYGRNEKIIDINSISSVERQKKAIIIKSNGGNIKMPIGRDTSKEVVENFLYDIKLINGNINIINNV